MNSKVKMTIIGATALILSVLIYTIGASYRQSQKIEVEELREAKRKRDIVECLKVAEEKYQGKRNRTCSLRGLKDGCGLDYQAAKYIDDIYTADKDRCYKL